MRISVCGLSVSGKSTLAKMIAEYYGLEFISSGKIFREEATKRGLKLEEMSKKFEIELDYKIDETTKTLCNTKDSFVIEGRLVCYFCKESLKIYLHAPLEVRAKRYSERENIPFEEALNAVRERDTYDLKRYAEIYGIDDYDKTMKSLADLVIDTKQHNIEDMFSLAKKFIDSYVKDHNRE